MTEIGEAERTTAPITVAPIKANVRIIVSPKFATQEPTKIITTHCEVRLIQIKFYRPNWFMRRSFITPVPFPVCGYRTTASTPVERLQRNCPFYFR